MERIEREYGLTLYINDPEYQKKQRAEMKEKEREDRSGDSGKLIGGSSGHSRYSGGGFSYEIRI